MLCFFPLPTLWPYFHGENVNKSSYSTISRRLHVSLYFFGGLGWGGWGWTDQVWDWTLSLFKILIFFLSWAFGHSFWFIKILQYNTIYLGYQGCWCPLNLCPKQVPYSAHPSPGFSPRDLENARLKATCALGILTSFSQQTHQPTPLCSCTHGTHTHGASASPEGTFECIF